MGNFILLATFFFCYDALAVKIGALSSVSQNDLVSSDIMLIDNNTPSVTSTRKITIPELDDRWLQSPNDSGVGLNDLWSASKIISAISAGTPTLQSVYNASTTPEIVVDSTRRALTIRDNISPIGTELFEIENANGSSKYFSVDKDKTYLGNALKINPITEPSQQEGLLFYNTLNKNLTFYNDTTPLNIGQQLRARVINVSGALIRKGQVVYITTATSGYPSIMLARADSISTSGYVGITLEDIQDSGFGYISNMGEIRKMDTSTFTLTDDLYLSDSVLGGITNVKPSYPSLAVRIGKVAVISPTDGVIMATIGQEFSNFTPNSMFYADENGNPANDAANLSYDPTTKITYSKRLKVAVTEDTTNAPSISDASSLGNSLSFVGTTPTSAQSVLQTGGSVTFVAYPTFIRFLQKVWVQPGSATTPSIMLPNNNTGFYLNTSPSRVVAIADSVEKMKVIATQVDIGDIAGNETLTVNDDGVASYYGSYGEMYFSNSTPATVTITNANDYYGFPLALNGDTKGGNYITFVEDGTSDRLRAGSSGAGLYRVNGSISFNGSNSQTVDGAIFKNGVIISKLSFKKGLTTSPPVTSASFSGFIRLAAFDYIDFRGTSSVSGATVNIYSLNISISRISK